MSDKKQSDTDYGHRPVTSNVANTLYPLKYLRDSRLNGRLLLALLDGALCPDNISGHNRTDTGSWKRPLKAAQ